MIQIDVKNRDAAVRWQSEVQRLNDETAAILNRITATLQTVVTGAEGELITNIANLCEKTINATTLIIQGMKGLFDAVGQVIEAFTSVIDDVLTDMSNTVARFFGGH